jgi:hypothetical protein
MSCPACVAFDAAERAALEGREMPAHTLFDCTCAEHEFDVLFISPERFRATPQVGTPRTMTWLELAMYLSRPSLGNAKDAAGAWSPALYERNIRRKSALVHACALVVDVDQAGDVDLVAEALADYRALVHETFSSTTDAPRCRLVLPLAQAIDASTYEAAHKIVRAHLLEVGVIADEGAKDASRVSYAPVRRAGDTYRFRKLEGRPFDARACLAAQPPPPPRSAPRLPASEHRDGYVRAALRYAADAVSSASEGGRHFALSREAYKLARRELGLDEAQIVGALLPAFVAAAGERREWEGLRTIRDAVQARQRAA